MNEETVDQQVQPEIQEQPIQEQPQAQVEQVAEPVQSHEDNALETNLKELRDARRKDQERIEQAEYERDKMARHIENMQMQLNGGQPQQPQNDFGISDDDYVQGEHLGKVNKSVKELQQEVRQWKDYSEQTTAELKLNSEYSDFNNVVTKDNVEKFMNKHPEMSGLMNNNDPLYTKGKAMYKLIKNFMGDNTTKPINQNNQRVVTDNFNKPIPSVAVKGQLKSPLDSAHAFANGYTEELGQALEIDMYKAIDEYNSR